MARGADWFRKHFIKTNQVSDAKKKQYYSVCIACNAAHEKDPDDVEAPFAVKGRAELLKGHLAACDHYKAKVALQGAPQSSQRQKEMMAFATAAAAGAAAISTATASSVAAETPPLVTGLPPSTATSSLPISPSASM